MKEHFYNSPEDCDWLRVTHLRHVKLAKDLFVNFKSFVLHGNEDCPHKIELYSKTNPNISDKPIIFILTEDEQYSILTTE